MGDYFTAVMIANSRGSPGMIDACVKVFDKKGVSRDVVFYDSFG